MRPTVFNSPICEHIIDLHNGNMINMKSNVSDNEDNLEITLNCYNIHF